MWAYPVERKFDFEDLGVSVSVFAPWRVVAAVLYTHTQPPTANLGTGRSASERVEFRRSTREAVRA